ncbi:hypothetical protein [Streptomyces sp. NPDC057702]|uniref:hypothetical protein n=1 Tax=Streptomyces sp. NPDC057702 TaxID=3346221 RepID=UPI00368FF509
MSDIPAVPYDPDEEAVVRRLKAQEAALADLLDQRGAPAAPLAGPVMVTVHGERFTVPLTARDIRAVLPEPAVAEFDQELAGAPPHAVGPLLRRWALETLSGDGDPLDHVDVLIAAERKAAADSGAAA